MNNQAKKDQLDANDGSANPLPSIDSVIPDPVKPHKRMGRPPLKRPDPVAPVAVSPAAPSFDATSLVEYINDIPLYQLTFDDCSLLLNTFSAASTLIATTRRERQEQLDAGTSQAPCATCKRPINITKSGGYQILTVRDEHFQVKNIYFCSQNCLLGRDMPSHRAKKLPGDVGAST